MLLVTSVGIYYVNVDTQSLMFKKKKQTFKFMTEVFSSIKKILFLVVFRMIM